VTIHGLTTPWVGGNCEVDLTGDAVAGILELSQGGVADIVNGGEVSGYVILAKGAGNSYTGQASFASLCGW
jgi:aspartate 1-decarboxylase